ncbi:SIS domain-containing protein [Roseisalinus antarcticus]|uniref:Glutamine--fructose-6-phosphate aminotransferase [isomerizing] n=1 Tax=Roseisalinus antarcticus TaxID=254357 RepID=A0A1Y5TYR1_9RHOB|nr:SIS domain-containing protein [Roseisalinus antarcticus]SLN74276.1 Glutamine--fructose-6-phosphate aminotransferase [isomerizing] [Roseisalinus antarcticus]
MTPLGATTLSEFLSQPEAWSSLLRRLGDGDLTPGFAPADHEEVILFGSGSSYYLGLAAADWMRRRGLPARALPSCEILLDPEAVAGGRNCLAIGLSRSGRSSELLLAAEILSGRGCPVAGVSCTADSAQLLAADHPLHVAEGHEDGLVMLRSFTSMLLTLQWMTGTAEDRAALTALPEAGRRLIADCDGPVAALARARDFDRFVFLASGASHPLALEAALKIQEMSISTSEAYHSLEYRHGPKACANARTLVCLSTLSDRAHGLSLARDMAELGAAVMVVGTDAAAYGEVANLVLPLPGALSPPQAAVLELLPMQLFAYHTAVRLGRDPDAPQNLSRVVTF